jgi:hypothetical protein
MYSFLWLFWCQPIYLKQSMSWGICKTTEKFSSQSLLVPFGTGSILHDIPSKHSQNIMIIRKWVLRHLGAPSIELNSTAINALWLIMVIILLSWKQQDKTLILIWIYSSVARVTGFCSPVIIMLSSQRLKPWRYSHCSIYPEFHVTGS